MVHALELLEVKFAIFPVFQIIQGKLNIGRHLVAVHRVDEEPHLLLRDEALFISIEHEKTEFEDLGDLEEAVGGDGRHELAEVDGLAVCCFYQVEQAVAEDRARHEDDLVVEVRDGDDGSPLLVVLLEHVPQYSYIFFLRAAWRRGDGFMKARSLGRAAKRLKLEKRPPPASCDGHESY